jgi:UDP-glucuronate 4-epimerase|tara:strand:- start:923 stop:1912 length:990 start_codon:yes stop_codon:yes gene_type:complete
MKVLVTGVAGFIGFHVTQQLLARGDSVVGVDNLNDYYDVSLKRARLNQLTLQTSGKFDFHKMDVADKASVQTLFATTKPHKVIHLAAQAGVRYSLENPHAYIDSNIQGFLNILEGCRDHYVDHLVYASSSSVYGGNTKTPFSVEDKVDHPLSLYGATKRANELMAHAYSHLYKIPTTGLRFFTVYGPWGRPDMSLYLFTKNILEGKPIDIFNEGNHARDFTYIDDIATGVVKVSDVVRHSSPITPYKIYNIGNSCPVNLMDMINILEEELGVKAKKNFLPMQPGDVHTTFADIEDFRHDIGYEPKTDIATGIAKFVQWYRTYHTAVSQG